MIQMTKEEWRSASAQLSPVYTFYLHKHVILLRIEAPNQLNPLGPAHLTKQIGNPPCLCREGRQREKSLLYASFAYQLWNNVSNCFIVSPRNTMLPLLEVK